MGRYRVTLFTRDSDFGGRNPNCVFRGDSSREALIAYNAVVQALHLDENSKRSVEIFDQHSSRTLVCSHWPNVGLTSILTALSERG